LHSEEFTPAPVAADVEATGAVSFTRSGLRADNSGATLLEQAERRGEHYVASEWSKKQDGRYHFDEGRWEHDK
jgi:hypothetical protein